MKKATLTVKTAIASMALAISALTVASCSNNADGAGDTATPAPSPAAEGTPGTLNIRYIDGDSISEYYNLAKDLKEQSVRAFSRLENEQNARAAAIQKLAQQIDEKMRNNGYLTEDSYNADMMKLNQMQQEAQNYMATLQRDTEQALAAQQLQLNDSIEAFIKDYNKAKGYDAILFKAAGVYFNPSLDITKEVIDGLNARYTKPTPSK